jgi:hypothetical protein
VTDKFIDWAAAAMSGERLEVSVTFDAERGYIASAPELRQPIVALSLGGLLRKVQALMVPDEPIVVLQLDGLAERERHRRRAKMGVTAP